MRGPADFDRVAWGYVRSASARSCGLGRNHSNMNLVDDLRAASVPRPSVVAKDGSFGTEKWRAKHSSVSATPCSRN